MPLNESTAGPRNFQTIGETSTRSYRFVAGHYGLSIMPTEYQKLMDKTLVNTACTFVYIDDILIVAKGKKVYICKKFELLEVLNSANLQSRADNCRIACTRLEWLGHELSGEDIAKVKSKVQRITGRLRPNNLRELRPFLGAVTQQNNFVPHLANIFAPFRSILKREAERSGLEDMKRHFKKITKKLKE